MGAADAAAGRTSSVRVIEFSKIRWLAGYFSGSKRYWALAVFATAVAAATEPLIPALIKPLLDRGFSAQGLDLWLVPASLLGLFAVRGLFGFISEVTLSRITQDGLIKLRKAMFARLLDARLQLFAEQNATALSNTLVYEIQNGLTLLVNTVLGVVKDSLALLALLAYLLYLNWQLTLVVFMVAPGVAWIMRTVSRRLYRIARSTQTATNDLAYVVEENVLASRVVRLHGAQQAQSDRFEGLGMALRRLALKAAITTAAVNPLTQMLAAAALSVVVCIALWQSNNGVTVGTFASFITAMLMLISPIKRLSDAANPVSRGMAAVQRAVDLLEHVPAEVDGVFESARSRGHIELREVSVRYREDGPSALDRFSLTVEPGQVVALVGPSGSGKSTLVNLLPRFISPDSGQVLLDGVDVARWRLRSLRAQFALVSQDVVMFNDTLAANIAMGSPVDMARMEQCVRGANLDALVASLPRGLDTVAGHNATELSGGQRQRLAIARALYKDAPILILDEATSALDAASERLVQEALQRLMAGRTTLIIAHRLSTIEHADRIVVLEQGRLAETGTHAQLLARGGLYARLHALQSGAE
ncbi:lipid A export permease/ATP-binding protein MsbA [Ramlibacter rhizophilus]|uniref:Lipid A export permease/ATP-binding protein MsbA n=1 Tax=Ramlibacter rhizophilus TaxID=1781167 RepID=A0A4Z0C1M8_9BURK|nr:lipid A export permease/ATP-binding protein MsbA [Ramlibacter rhizophilus]TFZ04842.1 lipid A export permease/ATP-binding protein MsbA [Ramlibacter rhizophilus]